MIFFTLHPLPFPLKLNSTQQKNKKVIFSCSHSSCTIFVLMSYPFETQIMLILILINVQYSENADFSFENFLNRQNHSSSGSYHHVKKSPSSAHYLLTQSQGNSYNFRRKRTVTLYWWNLGSEHLQIHC